MTKGRRAAGRRYWVVSCVLSFCLTVGASGCHRRHATEEDCARILDRIVEIELSERGFRDPILLERKRSTMHRLLDSELRECVGKRLNRTAISCVGHATSSEELSHRCLR